MHTAPMREKLFNIRFSEEEWARVEALTDFHGLNAAGLFRMLLKKEERALGPAIASAAASKREILREMAKPAKKTTSRAKR